MKSKRFKSVKNISKDRKFRKIMESMKKTFAKAEKERWDFLKSLYEKLYGGKMMKKRQRKMRSATGEIANAFRSIKKNMPKLPKHKDNCYIPTTPLEQALFENMRR